MTFSGKIKEEITKLECSKAEYISELSGIFRTTADIKLYCIRIQTENINVANRIFRVIKELYDVTANITIKKNYNFKKNEIHIIEIRKDVLKIINEYGDSSTEKLVKTANDAGGRDNVTVVMLVEDVQGE